MIIDLHTHYIDDPSALGEQLREDMLKCHVKPESWLCSEEEYLSGTAAADCAVCFGLRGSATGWAVSNARVAAFVKRHPEKYVYFASIDPLDADALDQLRFEHRSNGCRGLKLGPIYQGVHPLDERYMPLYEYCQANELPIMTHMATTFSSGVPIDYARPCHMDAVACRFPRLRIVMAHMSHPWEGEAIAVVRRNRNLYVDISALYYRPWQFYNSMRLAQEYGCTEKIFFGSDYPATTTADSIRGVLDMNKVIRGTGLPEISQSVLEDIVHRDSLAVLGIER